LNNDLFFRNLGLKDWLCSRFRFYAALLMLRTDLNYSHKSADIKTQLRSLVS